MSARPSTPDVVHDDGSRTITAKRCCNGCGSELGDVTDWEMACAVRGYLLPDVRAECSTCVADCRSCHRAGVDLEVCCSAHGWLLCQTCYCRTHFNETCTHSECLQRRAANQAVVDARAQS